MRRLMATPFRRILEGQKAMRRSQLELLPTKPGSVLFLGDSITEQGMWNEWFPELPTLNRGVGGDTVSGLHARLDRAVDQPALISLLIGTNDLSGLGPSAEVPDIGRQLDGLVSAVRKAAPDAPLLLNSVMPRKRSFAGRIKELNRHARHIAERSGAEYLDLWPTLANDRGELRAEFTSDNLHLSGEGYKAWVDVLGPAIARHLPVPGSPAAESTTVR